MKVSPIGLAALASIGLLLGACSGPEPGSAGNIPTKSVPGSGGDSGAPNSAPNSTPGNSGEQAGSAPSVTDPIDAAALTADVCAALTSAQLTELGLTEGTARQSAAGASCNWRFAEEDANRIDLTVLEQNQAGLSAIYDQKSQFAYFEGTEVAGYPAVYASEADQRSSGFCYLKVGLNDSTAVSIGGQFLTGAAVADPCPVVTDAAESMIETLKG
jgi:hypothetical protein